MILGKQWTTEERSSNCVTFVDIRDKQEPTFPIRLIVRQMPDEEVYKARKLGELLAKLPKFLQVSQTLFAMLESGDTTFDYRYDEWANLLEELCQK